MLCFDESRFNNRLISKKIRYLCGYKVVDVDKFDNSESINLILMISSKKYYYQVDEDNFNHITFLKFIVNDGFLKRNQILIMDNCSIHKAKKIREILK